MNVFVTALYKIESDDERLIVVLFGGECNQCVGDTVLLVIYRVHICGQVFLLFSQIQAVYI